jgi:Icc protein
VLTPAQQRIVRLDGVGGVVRAVQITDTHLCQENGGRLLRMDTDHSLQEVIKRVRRERDRIDLVLGTGDLSDRGSQAAYERLQCYFRQLQSRDFWLVGNHDDREAMSRVVASGEQLSGAIEAGAWQVIMLDSQVPGEIGGELGPAQLAWLREQLQRGSERGMFALVCLHHQPVPVGCAWLDEQMIADAAAFFAVLEQFPRVRGVLWGHVHQQLDLEHRGIKLMATPSTCVQFAPGSERFRTDDKPPGYRWLDLHSDGRIETGVSRVTDVVFDVDLESRGYL